MQELLDLVAPRRCAGCDAPGALVCAVCVQDLRTGLVSPAVRVRPDPEPEGFPPTWAQGVYAGILGQVVRRHKDEARLDLTAWCAPYLRGALARCLQEDPVVTVAASGGVLLLTSVPSASRAVRARGRDPLWDILVRALPSGGRAALAPTRLLRVARPTRDQAGLDAVARAGNLRGAMRVRRSACSGLQGRVVIVVDDIVTTGSTLVEAHRALHDAGAAHVVACTIAATRRAGYGQGMKHTVGATRARGLLIPASPALSRGGDLRL